MCLMVFCGFSDLDFDDGKGGGRRKYCLLFQLTKQTTVFFSPANVTDLQGKSDKEIQAM